MVLYFLDSSALVKRYIKEVGSAWVLGIFNPALNPEFFIAAVTGVEIVAAITRRSRGGSISQRPSHCNHIIHTCDKGQRIRSLEPSIPSIFCGPLGYPAT